jgi:phospholysine phosphohistidine inorganic pyrophosphate phosphatase
MRGILFDLDGVLYNAEEPIAGAVETMAWIQARGIPYLFVTNTSSRGRAILVDKLKRFGIETNISRILTPCTAAAEWMRKQPGGAAALFVKPKAFDEFEGLEILPDTSESGAGYVVIGDLGDDWDFKKLNRAFRLLHSSPEAVLIALGMTRFWMGPDGLRLDTAPFVAALECATGRRAIVFGKPEKSFYLAAAARLSLPPEEIVMVGDGIDTDIAAARNTGIKGVLVRTGKFSPSDLEGPVRPDAVLDSIRDIPEWFKVQGSRFKI